MKFYISAKWTLHKAIENMRDYIIEQGHELTVDWTTRAFSRDYVKFDKSKEYAKEEVNAILESDIFIHLSDGEGGKGKYVDLGIALTGRELQGKPDKIYVIGSQVNESQFYFHPSVERIISKNYLEPLEKILKQL